MYKNFIDYLIIKKSGLFDATYYLLQYPDIRHADVDPLWHFVRNGWRENKNPSAMFETEFYLGANADVRQTNINPLMHYIRFGQKEGRMPNISQGEIVLLRSNIVTQTRKLPQKLQNLIYLVGERIYWLIPGKHRQSIVHWFYARAGLLFRGHAEYEMWLANQRKMLDTIISQSKLIDINLVEPASKVDGKIAVHLHIFYADLTGELRECLENMPFYYDLFISATDEKGLQRAEQISADLEFCKNIYIKQVPNRGRNIAPIFCTFGEKLSQYEFIAHLHTKKSKYNQGATDGWREYLYHNLAGDTDRIRRIFTLLQKTAPFGIVYPQNYFRLPYWGNTWLANRELAAVWGAKLGIGQLPFHYFDYPAGSMFWARGDALSPLFRTGISLDDFPKEDGQTDGTLAHALERLFVLVSARQGMLPAIIMDEKHPSWSTWRFDQYINRSYQYMLGMLKAPYIKLIVFDIFDTLLSRPLLNPETIKHIVARRADKELGQLYIQYRASAEQHARYSAKRDVGLDEIYTHLGKLTGLSQTELQPLQRIEEEIEEYSLKPRQEVLRLYKDALETGTPVVLLSDMFLKRKLIERYLRSHGISDWQGLFISGEIGLRKDTGELYRYVLDHYGLTPSQMLVVGDNERSDAQIPVDMQASSLHLLKPVEFARGLPRFSPLIIEHEQRDDIYAEITLGLVIRKNFSHILYPSFNPASLVQAKPYNWGYSFLGPLLVSFSDWLVCKAKEENIERLHFLSREGRLMKAVYDCWVQQLSAPQSNYLVLSRRAAGVAAIAGFEDILKIAATEFFPNSIEKFLYTRYGLVLSDERWMEIANAVDWKRNSVVEVKNSKVNHLVPLLRFLEKDIIAKMENERNALLMYLAEKGVTVNNNQAVVDIGFGGSIQGYLNELLSRKINGYYLMTDDRAAQVSAEHNVSIHGCFFEDIVPSKDSPIMYRHSFDLEKLLSTTEPQVEYYYVNTRNKVEAHYRPLSAAEKAPARIRTEIHKGALDYAIDARQVREDLLAEFHPSSWTAKKIMEKFLLNKSSDEVALLSKIVLDDYYCGRELVF